MADITLRVEASGENLAKVTAELLELLSADARLDVRQVASEVPGGAKSGTGLTVGELVVSGVLSAASVRAGASVLVSWLQGRAERKVTLKSVDDEIVIDGTPTRAQQELVEKWLRERG
ncbi:hypothetical protein PV646_01420 [Streptomyces sp. ID05-26A]|nr:hypothetical protein [Streptomyces sp. ID05-26A]